MFERDDTDESVILIDAVWSYGALGNETKRNSLTKQTGWTSWSGILFFQEPGSNSRLLGAWGHPT